MTRGERGGNNVGKKRKGPARSVNRGLMGMDNTGIDRGGRGQGGESNRENDRTTVTEHQ